MADRPIFWYRPEDGKTYRVVYADLSVRDANAPPPMPAALPGARLAAGQLHDRRQKARA